MIKEVHFKDGVLHNEDGPAVIYENGTKRWYIDGKAHREDGAAVEYKNGKKIYLYNGRLILSVSNDDDMKKFSVMEKYSMFG